MRAANMTVGTRQTAESHARRRAKADRIGEARDENGIMRRVFRLKSATNELYHKSSKKGGNAFRMDNEFVFASGQHEIGNPRVLRYLRQTSGRQVVVPWVAEVHEGEADDLRNSRLGFEGSEDA